MKQIILKNRTGGDPASRICSGRLLMVWGLYGWAVAALWRSAGSDPWAQACVWGLALLAALALAIPMLEV
jgi:hypothetical protein